MVVSDASGGEALRPPPQPPSSFFILLACLLSRHQHHRHQHQHHQQQPQQQQRQEQVQNKDHHHGRQRCVWGGGAAPSPPTPLQLLYSGGNMRKYRKTEVFPAVIFVVLKLPCLDVETDAKNPVGLMQKPPASRHRRKKPPWDCCKKPSPASAVAKNPRYRMKCPHCSKKPLLPPPKTPTPNLEVSYVWIPFCTVCCVIGGATKLIISLCF